MEWDFCIYSFQLLPPPERGAFRITSPRKLSLVEQNPNPKLTNLTSRSSLSASTLSALPALAPRCDRISTPETPALYHLSRSVARSISASAGGSRLDHCARGYRNHSNQSVPPARDPCPNALIAHGRKRAASTDFLDCAPFSPRGQLTTRRRLQFE